MTTNLSLIIDGESSFLQDKVAEIYKNWGYPRHNVYERTEWTGPQRGKSLFGDKTMIHLNLEDKNDMKKFVNLLSNKKSKSEFQEEDWFGNGLIITCSTAQGAKKIQDLVKKSKGTIVKKQKPEERKAELLKDLSLPSESIKLVDYHVGEDYQMLISFVNEMKKLTKDEQMKIGPDKVLTYFSPTPGSVLPWKFMNPLLDGNTIEAINQFKLTIKNTHILVPMLFLQRQISLLLKISISRIDIPNNPKHLAETIGEKPYGGFWPVYNVAKRTRIVNVEKAAMIVNQLENDIKGMGKVNPENEFIATLAQLGLLLNH